MLVVNIGAPLSDTPHREEDPIETLHGEPLGNARGGGLRPVSILHLHPPHPKLLQSPRLNNPPSPTLGDGMDTTRG